MITLFPRICLVEQEVSKDRILGAVSPFVRHVSEFTGSHIIDGVTVPLRIRVSLTIAPERKLVEDLVRFLSRISVIIMTDRQKVTSIREKADTL